VHRLKLMQLCAAPRNGRTGTIADAPIAERIRLGLSPRTGRTMQTTMSKSTARELPRELVPILVRLSGMVCADLPMISPETAITKPAPLSPGRAS
jgi:hypothetical protein